MTLVNLLMDMASAADRRGTERAAARLVTLLYPHLRRWGRADPDAEDIALEVLWRACTGASRCRAIHLPPGRERERQAWAWVWRIHGRVAIVEGTAGRVYVLLATWPRGSPEAVEADVDRILGSMKTGE